MVLQIGEKSFSSVIFEAKGIKKKKNRSSLRLTLDLFGWYSQHRYAVYTLFRNQMCRFGWCALKILCWKFIRDNCIVSTLGIVPWKTSGTPATSGIAYLTRPSNHLRHTCSTNQRWQGFNRNVGFWMWGLK